MWNVTLFANSDVDCTSSGTYKSEGEGEGGGSYRVALSERGNPIVLNTLKSIAPHRLSYVVSELLPVAT